MAKTKQSKKRLARRSTKRLTRGMLFLLITATIIGIFVYIPFFTLREIKLVGASYLTRDDIIKIGNLYLGEPLFQLETDDVTKRLLQDLRIEEAKVKRELPFTLEVEIKERRPLATVVCDYGYLDLDRNGKVLDSYKTLKIMPIPMITGTSVQDLYIGDDVTDELVKKILFFLQQLNETSLNKLSEVAIIDADYIVAYTNTAKAVQIRIGKLERLEEKARLTEDFLQDLELNPHKVEYVDFNYTAPFIKLAQ